ncbi:hypothetical protein BpHYR1_000232 [Brachionus plicatilis]|uniref:Uncharacterized protein n=1 Tax=Brachionus plicatilis TaxID=10195 RepID=A0A3M7PFJ5_BRAPC|nr:hypothetical protein BpHYR1_000232 [Brachionus plicatilis]
MTSSNQIIIPNGSSAQHGNEARNYSKATIVARKFFNLAHMHLRAAFLHKFFCLNLSCNTAQQS